MRPFNPTVAAAAIGLCATAAVAFPPPPTSWDAAADFDATSNPTGGGTGPWSYGYHATGSLSDPFLTMTNSGSASGIDYWSAYPGGVLPWVSHNPAASTVNYYSVTYPAGSLLLHPGASGELAVVRFTAPAAATYTFSADFIGRDVTSTDVHVLVNGVSVYNSTVFGYGSTASSGPLSASLSPGDTIEAMVGFWNFSYYNDSTQLIFHVAPTPGAAAALGLGGLLALRRRRA